MQVLGANCRCVDFPLVGKFFKRANSNTKCCFVPHLDFLESGRFKFADNESNIGPFSKKLSSVPSAQPVSASAIGAAANLERDEVMILLKEAMVKFIQLARRGKDLKLDLRIGILHAYPSGDLHFENELNAHGDDSKLKPRVLQDVEDPI